MTTAAPAPAIEDLGAAWPWPRVSEARRAGEPTWFETTEERWWHLLEVLPPVYFAGGFCMGEPADSDARGVAVHAAVLRIRGRFFVRELPLDRCAEEARRLRDHLGA